MRALVTGAAGFIGSHLSEALVEAGHDVLAVDCFTDYYSEAQKRGNLRGLASRACFTLVRADLAEVDLDPLLDGVEVVFHQAGQPGVRGSWAHGFGEYLRRNVLVTQRLLEAARHHPLRRFVFASSSSVYGNSDRYPTVEADPTRPYSPYGVTKLAAEHLVRAYADNWGVPTVALRYFSVYGPRQRPDMAMHRLIGAATDGGSFPIYGDGRQTRDFTYVGDVVAANLLAASRGAAIGAVVNVGGGSSTTMARVIELVSELTGRHVRMRSLPEQPGDTRHTGASIVLAADVLGWLPEVTLRDGLAAQILWQTGVDVRVSRPASGEAQEAQRQGAQVHA